MFGYHNTVRRFRAESKRVAIPAIRRYSLNSDLYMTQENRRHNPGMMLKFAACFTAAVVIFGIAAMPSVILPPPTATNVPTQGGSTAQQHAFALVAYAAEANGSSVSQGVNEASKTILQPDIKVQLPNGKVTRDHLNADQPDYQGVMRYSYSWSSDYLTCEGDDIQSVTYRSAQNHFIYLDRYLERQMESDGKARVCNLAVPGSVPPGSSIEQISNTFQELGKNGKLNAYNKKEIDIGDGNTVQFTFSNDWDGVNISFNGNVLEKIWHKGSEITTRPGGKVIWSPSEVIWGPISLSPNFTDYVSLPPDTLTITAKFTDGQTLSKIVAITFNADGSYSATLQGK